MLKARACYNCLHYQQVPIDQIHDETIVLRGFSPRCTKGLNPALADAPDNMQWRREGKFEPDEMASFCDAYLWAPRQYARLRKSVAAGRPPRQGAAIIGQRGVWARVHLHGLEPGVPVDEERNQQAQFSGADRCRSGHRCSELAGETLQASAMRKHVFLVRWKREGRIVTPVLDAYATCIWPLGPEDNDVVSARALLAMIGGQPNLPDDVKSFCSAYTAILLRLRYQNGDTTGPYMINDVDNMHTDQSIQEWIINVPDDELHRYHVNNQRVNRERRG
jgi:hypothetical protein